MIQELQKRLETHWKNIEKETKRTHSGKLYEKYMEKDKKEKEKDFEEIEQL